jgi:hypothetical protein
MAQTWHIRSAHSKKSIIPIASIIFQYILKIIHYTFSILIAHQHRPAPNFASDSFPGPFSGCFDAEKKNRKGGF